VVIAERQFGRGVGRTKKEAELKAAAAAWSAIDAAGNDETGDAGTP
jgi:ribonuclease-3